MKETIGVRIKAVRESARDGKGISQAELAELVGVNQTALSQIESGKTVPRKPTLIALSFILNDDFGEEWLQDFFKSVVNKERKEFNHALVGDLFSKADDLDEKSIKEMQHIWEMLRSEIKRRK